MTQPASASGGRPIGQPKNPGREAILSLVTCGFYGLYWDYLTFEELKQYNGEGQGGGIGLLLCWILVGYFILLTEIQKMFEADGKKAPFEPIEALWLLVPLYGIYKYITMVQSALNDFWVSKGAAPAA
jgi:hypothetical protein